MDQDGSNLTKSAQIGSVKLYLSDLHIPLHPSYRTLPTPYPHGVFHQGPGGPLVRQGLALFTRSPRRAASPPWAALGPSTPSMVAGSPTHLTTDWRETQRQWMDGTFEDQFLLMIDNCVYLPLGDFFIPIQLQAVEKLQARNHPIRSVSVAATVVNLQLVAGPVTAFDGRVCLALKGKTQSVGGL